MGKVSAKTAFYSYIILYSLILSEDSEDHNQTTWMCRLIWDFVVRIIMPGDTFSHVVAQIVSNKEGLQKIIQVIFAGRQHSFMEIDHEIFSTVILSLLLIQEGQLSVSGERMCTVLVNHLED